MNITRKLPDDWLSGVGYVGLLMLVGSSMYARGRYDASSLPLEKWATEMAHQGPMWPLATGLIGLLLIYASLATLLYTECWKNSSEK